MTRFKESAFILLLSLIVATNLYDLLIDYSHNASVWHLLEESLVVLASTLMICSPSAGNRRASLLTPWASGSPFMSSVKDRP